MTTSGVNMLVVMPTVSLWR